MQSIRKTIVITLFITVASLIPTFSISALADESNKYELTIQNIAFDKSEIKVPADKPALLLVNNQDQQPFDFICKDIGLEKTVSAHSERIIYIRMLKPGRYTMEIEHHEKTGHSMLIVE